MSIREALLQAMSEEATAEVARREARARRRDAVRAVHQVHGQITGRPEAVPLLANERLDDAMHELALSSATVEEFLAQWTAKLDKAGRLYRVLADDATESVGPSAA